MLDKAEGVYTIAATPFYPDGRIDYESVDRLTDFYLKCGVTGITILGVLGEAPKLDAEEALAVGRLDMSDRARCGRVHARCRRDKSRPARVDRPDDAAPPGRRIARRRK